MVPRYGDENKSTKDYEKEVRKELKMTQRELGESAGSDRRYVAKVECGSNYAGHKEPNWDQPAKLVNQRRHRITQIRYRITQIEYSLN